MIAGPEGNTIPVSTIIVDDGRTGFRTSPQSLIITGITEMVIARGLPTADRKSDVFIYPLITSG